MLDLRQGEIGVHYAEVTYGVDLHGDVIAGDDVLRGDIESFDAQGDAREFIYGEKDQAQAGAKGIWLHPAQAQDDAAFPFLDDEDGVREPDEQDDYGYAEENGYEIHLVSSNAFCTKPFARSRGADSARSQIPACGRQALSLRSSG